MQVIVRKTVNKVGVSDRYINDVVKRTLKETKNTACTVGVSVVGEMRMQTLNRTYRHKNYVTDVLSFVADDDFLPGNIQTDKDLGDIVICAKQIKRQAKEFGIPYKQEFTRMLVHGILHLLGYDHIKKRDAKVMLPMQENIVKKIMS